MRLVHAALATLVVASSAWVTNAGAQNRVTQTIPAQTVQTRSDFPEEYSGPDRGLLLGGFLMLGMPYLVSFGVAATSDHPGDQRLFIPVAGPWLDLNERGTCRGASAACDTETANQVLLIGNGVLQGLGALQIVGAFLFPEEHVVTTTIAATKYTPKMTISPTNIGKAGYGLSAVGTF